MKTIIFDFDGTLADSFDIIAGIIGKLTKKHVQLTDEQIEKFKDLTVVQIAKYLGVKKFKWPFLIRLGRKEMTKQIDSVKLHQDIDKYIRLLAKRNVRLYILSSNSKQNILHVIEKYGIRNCFQEIYGNVGILSKAKAIKKVIRMNKLDNGDVLYVGDEVRDAVASENLGVAFIGVTWGFSSSRLLSAHRPYKVVESPRELNEAIEDWIK